MTFGDGTSYGPSVCRSAISQKNGLSRCENQEKRSIRISGSGREKKIANFYFLRGVGIGGGKGYGKKGGRGGGK